ncbi:hypothetical protein QVD17_02606 [Tagetes erecta]|uniref:Protein kinase domain-containing protein n=1 Tax=Tagetes erecta TaxID=13708 RepID=A0AAD8L8J0_TARER|nr:hypothetical protein QVD17_02606 [Tagetes erecta]
MYLRCFVFLLIVAYSVDMGHRNHETSHPTPKRFVLLLRQYLCFLLSVMAQPSTSIQWLHPCRKFEFPEILTATQNFDESLVIGSGGFGKVHKGNLINGSSVVVAAIKRLDSMSNQGATAEVEMLSTLRHCNLVSFIGYCVHEKEKILVYEYMPNGTLDDHLHKYRTRLSWLQRLNICIGAGRGLRYLHDDTGIDSGVIHRDVKSSNILLHESWAAKISDFGLSKTCPKNQPSTHVNTHVKGSFGYLDPIYFITGILTRKSDVYAFGVVLLEVLCRKRALDRSLYGENRNLATWAQDSIKEGNLKYIIDSDLSSEISPKCLKEFTRIVERCLHHNPKQRPTMAGIVANLETVLALQEQFDSLLPASSKTIFGRMLDMLPFSSNGGNSVDNDSNQSSNSKDNNVFPVMKGVPTHFRSPSPSLKEFRIEDLKKATRKFSVYRGSNSYGDVYQAWVDENTLAPSVEGVGIGVDVKRFRKAICSQQGCTYWLAEVILLGYMDHPNIIRLLGYCKNKKKHLLVYVHQAKSNLNWLLVSGSISWRSRLLVMIGVARGLAYLHQKNVIHCDLNCSNIIVDENFEAQLKGFELTKYCLETAEYLQDDFRSACGPLGSFDPHSRRTGKVTKKTDVYSFGLVLLQCLSGKQECFYTDELTILIKWATDRSKHVKEIMDPRLIQNYPLQDASECHALALRCVAEVFEERPSSEEVLQSLEQLYARSS